jgi:rapamycin-insensitive companion of mTOR
MICRRQYPYVNERLMHILILGNSIKSNKVPGFSRPFVFHKVMNILEAHHFRLPACRFVLDLFDKRVLQQIVLEEEDELDNDESSESDSESGSDESHTEVNGAKA